MGQKLDPVTAELANVMQVNVAAPYRDRSTEEMLRRLTSAKGRDRVIKPGSLDTQGPGKGSHAPTSVIVPSLARCHDTCSSAEMPRHSRTKFFEFSGTSNGQGEMSEAADQEHTRVSPNKYKRLEKTNCRFSTQLLTSLNQKTVMIYNNNSEKVEKTYRSTCLEIDLLHGDRV